jgi:hypothetical protein
MDSEYNIRPPDNTKREQLIQDTRSDFDKQLDEALHLSLQECINQNQINNFYEDEIITNYLNEISVRREKFYNLIFDLNKLIRFDKDIKEIYEIIEPIIDAYCNQYIQRYEVDEITYDKIFKIIGTIRTDKKNIELLKNVIIKNH